MPDGCAREIEQMPELAAFGLQVVRVLDVGWDLDRDALDDLEAEAFESDHLARIVCHQAHFADAEIVQDLRA